MYQATLLTPTDTDNPVESFTAYLLQMFTLAIGNWDPTQYSGVFIAFFLPFFFSFCCPPSACHSLKPAHRNHE